MARKLIANPVKQLQSQVLEIADFTDNTDTTGYIDFSAQLPAGAIVLGWKADITDGFTGDTTAVMEVGISGSLDDFSAITTASCLTDASEKRVASKAATSHVDSATTARVTVTGAADFTSITAGKMRVTLYYLDTNAKPI